MLGRELAAEPGAYLTAAGGGDAPETELPDDAILCSCNNVSAGTIRDTINGCGACDGNAPVRELGELKGCTRAGTSCGSCVPMLKKLLETELTKSGVEVSKALCEHIELSRQELFDDHPRPGTDLLRGGHGQVRHRGRLRHLQADHRQHPGQPEQRLRPERRQCRKRPARCRTSPSRG